MASRLPIRIAVCVIWLVAVGVGMRLMLNYQNAAGRTGETPPLWPSDAALPLEHDRATLLFFAHPRCPCSRAALGELNRLLARCPGQITAHVLFLKPSGQVDDWTQTDLWRSAAAIPGVTVHEDRDGGEARRFGAETSSYVVLYDPRGGLLFKGGITSGRGHAGDNAGADAIALLLAAQDPGVRQTPVYGCSLVNASGTNHLKETLCRQ